MTALAHEGQRQVAVGPAGTGVELDGLVEGRGGFLEVARLEVDVAQLIPVLRIVGIDLNGFLVGADGFAVAILLLEDVTHSNPGADEALVELDGLLLISHDSVEDLAEFIPE